jgi:hypothetical protein
MKIEINSSDTLENLQQIFNAAFPFLKIEFFTQPHEKGKPTAAKHLVSPKEAIGEFSKTGASGSVNVQENMTVFELEKIFEEKFGLHVQVFRKSGRIWLETTATDGWTLVSQNEHGKELSEFTKEKGETPDYHEQE